MITSTDNPRVKRARKLRQRKYRHRHQSFLVTDEELILMALRARRYPLEVFYCQPLLQSPEALQSMERVKETTAELIPVSQEVIGTLSERESPHGIAAVFPIFQSRIGAVRRSDRLVLVADKLQDPGNLGTLIRTADAVGAAAMVLVEPCVDPFDPKVVRGSMGSIFNLPIILSQNIKQDMAHLRELGYVVVGADAVAGDLWGTDILQGAVCLVVGNESRGISQEVRELCDQFVHLPIVGKAESLNVAVAAGVLMYLWLKQRYRHVPHLPAIN